MWYRSSRDTIADFDAVGQRLKLLKVIPNPFPFYDWIMGFYERRSDRDALDGPVLDGARNILDVGAGTGYLLGQLAAATHEAQAVTAIDLSPQMLIASRRHLETGGLLRPRVHFVQADCLELPLPDGSVDLYVSSYLFDLLPDLEIGRALAEMERVLRQDGCAILLTMTTELEGVPRIRGYFDRCMNALYCLGYEGGRWNPIWRALFEGYAPHCRPIALGKYLKESPRLMIAHSKVSRVSLFAVRIHYVRKGHG